MIFYVVETLRANGTFMADCGHVHLHDAIDEANETHSEDLCCDQNVFIDDDFKGPCPGGCETRTPRIVEYRAERVEK